MTAYKVVKKEDRTSVLIADHDLILKYLPNTIVTSKVDYIGIFCFKTKKDAENFIQDTLRDDIDYIIIKVQLLNKIIEPQQCGVYRIINGFFQDDPFKIYVPIGTICSQSVKVLE